MSSSSPRLQLLAAKLARVAASPAFELRFLAQQVLGHGRPPSESQLGACLQQMTAAQFGDLLELVRQRTEQHKPLQYILGDQPFAGLSIRVRPPVLIPRWETEEWVVRLMERLAERGDEFVVWDLCTGSGCIALAMHRHLQARCAQPQVYGVDVNPQAIQLATENAAQNQLHGVKFVLADLMQARALDNLPRPHLIVSNPPYIAQREYDVDLDPSVRDWEDRRALVGGLVGTEFHERIAAIAQDVLRPSAPTGMPRLAMEIGETQGGQVQRILQAHGFSNVIIEQDMAGRHRCVVAQ
ncbi:hypothetical protein RI367_002208 [Sorochytrium milnesiophthora]